MENVYENEKGTTTYTGYANTYAETNISFRHTFAVVPQITAELYIVNSGIKYTQEHVITNVTVNGFTIKAKSLFSNTYNTTVTWTATAPLA